MQNSAFVLVSCARCHRLHEPPAVDVSHPVCPQCATAAMPRPPSPFPVRPLGSDRL